MQCIPSSFSSSAPHHLFLSFFPFSFFYPKQLFFFNSSIHKNKNKMIVVASPAGSSSSLVIICLFICGTVSFTRSEFYHHDCGNQNITSISSSIYKTNLDRAQASLISAAETSNSGFYNTSVGKEPDKVNALVYCRDDVQPDICRSCVKDSMNNLRERCPLKKSADIWYDECVLRYSNTSILYKVETWPTKHYLNERNVSDIQQFNKKLRDLLDKLKGQAIQTKFARGNISGPDFLTIYGLMLCSPDLSSTQCSNCLDGLMGQIQSCCSTRVGARIFNPSCQLRFEPNLFYNESLLVDARPPPPVAAGKDDSGTGKVVIIIVVVIVGIGILILVLVCLFKRKPKQRATTTRPLTQCPCLPIYSFMRYSSDDNAEEQIPIEMSSSESLQKDFGTIVKATDNFSDSNKLGKGGFATVYKGKLPNNEEIAVKRLSKNSAQCHQDFENEVRSMAKLQHRNLLRLRGYCYCNEGSERLLIFEYMPNASLDRFIFDPVKSAVLDWERRYKIIKGVAKGILYLHEDSTQRIIHRDLKPSNVLLDAEMNPKIADFGLARLFKLDETRGITEYPAGTIGYVAPEYAKYGRFSVKSDVFSFGVIVLEILSGQRNCNFRNGENEEDLASFAWKNWREGTPSNVIDPNIRNTGSIHEMERCIHIGLLCVQKKDTDRPTMASVVPMLNFCSNTLGEPSEPFRVSDNSETSVKDSIYETTFTDP